ncbi:uncharacterized protein N7479_010108 [Penicillium vulpinum]|uniref:uncharacterized protein n=1 Tax=Penicillium vulpinum TaxID=29845 RepID=UPI0025496A3C|nr:uncharacterized protein N7479_010108 [Penicillium vulpinum]KAJ5951695.1 hypothetical protein N7479_010108 [Penicillium vulpinum]
MVCAPKDEAAYQDIMAKQLIEADKPEYKEQCKRAQGKVRNGRPAWKHGENDSKPLGTTVSEEDAATAPLAIETRFNSANEWDQPRTVSSCPTRACIWQRSL